MCHKPLDVLRLVISFIENEKKNEGKNIEVEMPGIEPGASHMQSERSTTELHPLSIWISPIFPSLYSYFIFIQSK